MHQKLFVKNTIFIYLFIYSSSLLIENILKNTKQTLQNVFIHYLSFIIYLLLFFFLSLFKTDFFYCLKHFANYTKLCFCEIHKTNPAKSICLFTYLFVYHMRATCASSETREVSRLQFFWLLFTLHLRAG